MFRSKKSSKNAAPLPGRLGLSSSSNEHGSVKDRLSFSSKTERPPIVIEKKESSPDVSSDEDEERSGSGRERTWRYEKEPHSQYMRKRPSTDVEHMGSDNNKRQRQRQNKKLKKQNKEAAPVDDISEDQDKETVIRRVTPTDFISGFLSQIEDEEECQYFARGLCKRGNSCKFVHKEPNIGSFLHKKNWQNFCPNFPPNCNLGTTCSNLHVTLEDQMCFKNYGVISYNVLEQAIKKVLLLDVPVQDDVCVCKQNLGGGCAIVNCPFLHISKLEFLRSVLAIVKEEFFKTLGPSMAPVPVKEMEQDILWAFLDSNRNSQSKAACSSLYQVGPDPAYMSASELQHANDQLTQESATYFEYCEALQRENAVLFEALDPEQPGPSSQEIRRRLQLVFDTIASESKVTSLAKSLGIERSDSKVGSTQGNEDLVQKVLGSFETNTAMLGAGLMSAPAHSVVQSTLLSRIQDPQPWTGCTVSESLETGDQGSQPMDIDPMDIDPLFMESNPPSGEQCQTTVSSRKECPPPSIPYPNTPWVQVKTRRLRTKVEWNAYYKYLLRTKVFGVDQLKRIKDLFDYHLREVGINREEPMILSDSDSDGEQDQPKPKKKLKVKPDKRRLIVHNLSNVHDEATLQEYFSKFGKLMKVFPRPFFFFLKYETGDYAQAVLDHGTCHEIKGFTLTVREDQGRLFFGIVDEALPELENTLIIKGLKAIHDPTNLEEYFSKFGKLTRFVTRLNYALVSYADADVMQRVLKQEEPHEVNGGEILVKPFSKTSIVNAHQNHIRRERNGVSCDPTKRLYVGIQDPAITEDNLRETFSKFGELEEVKIRNRHVGQSFGYLVYSTLQSAINAANSETEINGATITLKYVKTFFPNRREETDEEKERNFVEPLIFRKLPEELKSEEVEQYFAKFGEFYSFDTIYRPTGERRDMGFVTYRDRKVTEHVASLKNHTICGISLIVQFIDPRIFRDPKPVTKEKAVPEEVQTECDKDDPELLQARELGLMDELGDLDEEKCEESNVKLDMEKQDKHEMEEKAHEGSNKESKHTKESVPEPIRQKLYVGGLNETFRDEDLVEYFSTFGAIFGVQVKLNRKGHCRGYGFVTFVDNDVADRVATSDFHEIKGSTVVVKFANPLIIRKSKRYIQVAEDGALEE